MRLRSYKFFVVEEPVDFVKFAREDRLRHVEQTVRTQHAPRFVQRRIKQRHRHVMQGLQHDREIKRRAWKRNVLCACGDELHPRCAGGEICGVLSLVDLKSHPITRWKPSHQ